MPPEFRGAKSFKTIQRQAIRNRLSSHFVNKRFASLLCYLQYAYFLQLHDTARPVVEPTMSFSAGTVSHPRPRQKHKQAKTISHPWQKLLSCRQAKRLHVRPGCTTLGTPHINNGPSATGANVRPSHPLSFFLFPSFFPSLRFPMWWFLLALPLLAYALDPIEIKGNAFFVKGSQDRFYMRGLDYQPGGSSKLYDPLADPTTCERDIKYFKELGINTIRVYSIDNTADHDECMQQLADAGIYLILDVNVPKALIARDKGAKCSYNTMYLNEVLATVKLMSKYDNTLGFFAGNEVINDADTTPAAVYVKAVVRDIKTFQRNTDLRLIPVGYSAADIEENRLETAHYFNCGDDEMARVDMFGFNDYSWCGRSSFTTSGYDKKVEAYDNYSIPLFLSEFGCNKITPRPFTEILAIFSDKMLPVFSGGLVYEYSMEGNDYGLVQISLDNKTVTTNDDFDNLKEQFSSAKNPSGDGGYHTGLPFSECPEKSDVWEAEDKLPDTPKGALKYIKGTVDPEGNGFDADTQWACVDGGNDTDDSDDHSSVSRSSTRSSTRSSSGSSSATSGSSLSLSLSSSKKSGTVHYGPSSLFGLCAAFMAMMA